MKRVTFKILFFVKKTRVAKNGEVPILLRVTVNGFRADTSINLKVNPDLWNSVAGKSVGKDRTSAELNQRLDTIRLRVMQIHRQMELDGVHISAQGIINKYLGRDEKPQIMLLDVFKEHNDRCRKLEGNGMAAATVERYETSLKHTADFISFNFRKEDIPIEEVNHKFITDYEFYLRTERNCSHNTATKYLKNFKKIIRIALANEYITKDPFVNIKFRLEEVEKDFLEDHEIRKIIEKEITVERLAHVRDTFIFATFTGLAFSDLKGLMPEHLAVDNNGSVWIRKKRQKTKNMCNIPLLEVPQQILEKYKDHPLCIKNGTLLPVISNVKMNAYLKELADICGITKTITTHTARYSFSTSVTLANGVSIENVAKMLGHSNTKMTQHYAKVLDKSILRDMENVQKRFAVSQN